MKKETQSKGLGRKRFIMLLGQSALGIWVMQFVPNLSFINKKPKQQKDPQANNKYAKKVAIHPLAVKRVKRG